MFLAEIVINHDCIYRKRYFMAEIEILQQLIGTAEDPLVKGRGLLELGLVYWQSGNKNNLYVLF